MAGIQNDQQKKAVRRVYFSCFFFLASLMCLFFGLRMAYQARGAAGAGAGFLELGSLAFAVFGLICALRGRKAAGIFRLGFYIGLLGNLALIAGAVLLFAAGMQWP